MVLSPCSRILSDSWGSVSCLDVSLVSQSPHDLLSRICCYLGGNHCTSIHLREDPPWFVYQSSNENLNQQSNSANKTKNFQVAHTQTFHEIKESTAKFPPRDFVQQRILQARGHGTGTVTSQALPTLRAVPGKLLVLPRAQHPLQLQNKQDHGHSALMR